MIDVLARVSEYSFGFALGWFVLGMISWATALHYHSGDPNRLSPEDRVLREHWRDQAAEASNRSHRISLIASVLSIACLALAYGWNLFILLFT